MPKKRQRKLKDSQDPERDVPKKADFSTKEEWKKQLAKRKENRDRNLRKERFRKTVDTISIYVDQ